MLRYVVIPLLVLFSYSVIASTSHITKPNACKLNIHKMSLAQQNLDLKKFPLKNLKDNDPGEACYENCYKQKGCFHKKYNYQDNCLIGCCIKCWPQGNGPDCGSL